MIGYFTLGVIGGLLPDIDSATSIPIRIAFNMLAVVAGFLLVFTFGAHYSLLELVILWLGCYFGIRHGLRKLFIRFTTHRGLIPFDSSRYWFWLDNCCYCLSWV